jgi:hypothetical protein
MGDAADDMMFRAIGLPKTEFFTGKSPFFKISLGQKEIVCQLVLLLYLALN